MLLFLVALGMAAAIWKLFPAANTARPALHRLWMPVVAALLQIALGVPPLHDLSGNGRFVVVLTSYVVVGVWLVTTTIRQAPALRLSASCISLGWLANAIAIITNHGMPVSRWALAEIGVHHPEVAHGNLYKHLLAGPHTTVKFLGDCLPIALPIVRNVISIGDVLVLIGVIAGLRHVDVHAPHHKRSTAASLRDPLVLQATNPP